jgi:hypothetical protein|tara:strand:+ start:82 stop:330 length:249 start_codon:yes stop_codon:yes gene_type:complete
MSSEIHKYIETSLEKKQNLFNSSIINFPSDKKLNKNNIFKINTGNFWNIGDETNKDQLKAITGICFMLGVLTVIGLYSNLIQ